MPFLQLDVDHHNPVAIKQRIAKSAYRTYADTISV